MPTPDLPTDIDATDHAGLGPDDHEGYHDSIHGLFNQPLPEQAGGEKSGDYTLVLSDHLECVVMNNGAAAVVTIPPESSVNFPLGSLVFVYQKGSAQVTITPGTGVELRTAPNLSGSVVVAAQDELVCLWKRFNDKWVAVGNFQ